MRTHRGNGLGFSIGLTMVLATLSAWGQVPGLVNYQGRLLQGTNLVNGQVALELRVYDAPAGGMLRCADSNCVTVVDGLYSTYLGDDLIAGDMTWVAASGAFYLQVVIDGQPLLPRERVVAVPYALTAGGVTNGAISSGMLGDGAVTGAKIAAGAVGSAQIATAAVTSDKIADGAVAAADVNTASFSNTFWKTDGNAGTTAGTHFLGTTDNQPVEIKVNGLRALRIERNAGDVNIIGGAPNNVVGAGVAGAIIASGRDNAIGDNATWSVIAGGSLNVVSANSGDATIGGGSMHTVGTDSPGATVSGGEGSTVGPFAPCVTIAGGCDNRVGSNAVAATISGGSDNTVENNARWGTIGGGVFNVISNGTEFATIGGGFRNTMGTNAFAAVIPGGAYCGVGNDARYAFAAGRRAKAGHQGAFVWADSQNADFASTASNQFLIRAQGGVGINTNGTPGMLTVAGNVVASGFAGSGAGLTALDGGAIGAGSIGADQLAAGAVTGDKIADGAVTSGKIGGPATVISAINIPNPTPEAYDVFAGAAAAVGSDRFVLGASNADEGAGNAGGAYIYSADGLLLATVTNPAPESGDAFGAAVAAVGSSSFVVGAPNDRGATTSRVGQVHLYGLGGAWLASVTNPAAQNASGFGRAVAGLGSGTFAVGEPYHDHDPSKWDVGRVYLFDTSGALLATITNPAPLSGDRFGFALAAVASDRLAIGEPQDRVSDIRVGSVRLCNGSGAYIGVITNPVPSLDANFGCSLAAIGADRLAIGADGATYAGGVTGGVVHIYSAEGVLLQSIANPSSQPGDQFGCAVAAFGTDMLLVGAKGDNAGGWDAGRAYLYDTSGTLLATLANPDPASNEQFGTCVAALGEARALAGAPYSYAGVGNAGSAWCFTTGKRLDGLVASVPDGAITAAKLADGAVTEAKLADDAVTGDKIAAGSISNVHLTANAVNSGRIMDGGIAGVDLGANCVTSDKIADGSVSNADLAAGAVTADKIVAGAVLAEILDDDGSGSGLDADLLDGQHGSYYRDADLLDGMHAGAFATSGHAHAAYVQRTGDVMTGPLTNLQSVTAAEFANSRNTNMAQFVTALGGAGSQVGAGADYGAIGGGNANVLCLGAWGGTVAGGRQNVVGTNAAYAAIGGGWWNNVGMGTRYAAISGGYNNRVGTNAECGTIGGGYFNLIENNAFYSTIPGGYLCAVSNGADYALAAGRRAKAAQRGVFVWADSQNADFASTDDNQFLIRAGGGVGIGTNVTPELLTVAGNVKASAFIGSGAGLTGMSGGQLGANSVSNAVLAVNAVTSAKIVDGSVSNADLAVDAVTSDRILDGAVGTADLAASAVTSAKILDGGVSNVDLAANAVTSSKILDGTVTSADVASNTFWEIGGNANTTPGTHYLGTSDNQDFVLKVNNQTALRVIPHASGPKLIGGTLNSIGSSYAASVIGGGGNNSVSAHFATLGGGESNEILADSHNATIGGGGANSIGSGAVSATIPGGANCAVGASASYALAAGRRAKANHPGAFVWADSQNSDFASSATNEVSVRAAGGVRLIGSATLGALLVAPNKESSGDDSELMLGEDNDGTYGMALKYDGSSDILQVFGRSTTNTYGPHVVIKRGDPTRVGIGRTAMANELEVEGTASKTTAGDWLANSDARIKTDIQPIRGALDVIDALRPVSFQYSDEYRQQHPSVEDRRYCNFVAQEFQEVFPESVKDDGTGLLQVDTHNVRPYLVAAVQELHRVVKEKDARIAELEARLSALEQLMGKSDRSTP